MVGLGETTARLARARRGSTGPAPKSRMTEVSVFGDNPGALSMLAYRPEGLLDGAPVVVVLHGCTQRAEAFVQQSGWLTLADRCAFMVVAAEQAPANNMNRCFNWFEPQDIRRGGGEAASIAAMARHAISAFGADPDRVFVTGLSAGGAMTAVMLATYPDLFAGGAIIAGIPYGVAHGVGNAMSAMQGHSRVEPATLAAHVVEAAPKGAKPPRVSIWHGDADYTVDARNAAHSLAQWAAVHGLPLKMAQTELANGRTRTVLKAPGSSQVLVESNIVHGLGHGAPLSTFGAEGLGQTGPYMLEAGVSSTLEIATFWGLAPSSGKAAVTTTSLTETGARDAPTPAAPAGPNPAPDQPLLAVGDQVMAALAARVSPAVKGVIERALKAAGLQR